MLKIYNTATRSKEEFKPITPGQVKIYNCGPTVYSFQHIGNMYSSVFADTLRRIIEYLGYGEVIQVMNITDVGHLTDDADEGEDKMEKGANKLQKTVWEVAEMFTEQFLNDVQKLNIKEPFARPRATQFIEQIIALNEKIQEAGYAYETDEALYFDTSKFKDYGKLSGQKLEDKKQGVRDEVVVDNKKRNPQDFVLWFKRVGKYANHTMHWLSPWGDGFPGWHVECSAMSKAYLGETFDIHTGGVEHIPVHHTNEIAQSETANHAHYVNYWLHHQLILVDGQKMSKSLGNTYLLSDLEEKGFEPTALRLLFLQNKYREQLNFTFDSLQASQNSLNNLRKQLQNLAPQNFSPKATKSSNQYQQEFEAAIGDDLNTSVALAVMFKLLKDQNIPNEEKLNQILSFDEVFGLKLLESLTQNSSISEIPQAILDLSHQRDLAKQNKDYTKADEIRQSIAEKGYTITDTKEGGVVSRE